MNSSSNARIFLAVDAGGTKADFLLAQEDRELARARVDSIKVLSIMPDVAEANFVEALRQLEQISGISARRVTRTCIGASGHSVPAVRTWLREQHASHVGGDLLLCGDEEIAFEAAFPEGPGILALAGTGSNILGRAAGGAWVRAGGWGPVLGDEGSGHWIGLEALRTVFRGVDQGTASTLEQAVLTRWGITSRDDLVAFGNSAGVVRFAELTQDVVGCARSGDRPAMQLLQSAGEALATLVAIVLRRIQVLESGTAELPEVAITGSILENVAEVREAMDAALRRSWPKIVVRSQCADPLLGALHRARAGAPAQGE